MKSRRDLATDARALGALLVLHLLLFAGNLVGRRTFYYDDFSRYQLPLSSLVHEALRAGRLPLWNPYLWLGAPLSANPAAQVFYPPTWLLVGLDPLIGLNVAVVAHLFLGGVLTYALARERVGSGAAALAAGVSFSLGGMALSYTANPFYLFSLAWLPGALLAFFRALEGRTFARGTLGALAVALMALGGDGQLVLLFGLLALALAIAKLAGTTAGARAAAARRAAGALALVLGGGAGLAAVQLLPTFELVRLSERAAALASIDRQEFSFHPARLPTFLLPTLFGAPLPENSYWGFDLDGRERFWFFSVYAGAVMTCAAAAAVRRRDGFSLSLGVASAVFVVASLGRHTPVYEAAARGLPLLQRLRYPEKFLGPLAVVLPVLGAEGLARVAAGQARRRLLLLLGLAAATGAAAWALGPRLEAVLARRSSLPFLAGPAAARIGADGRALLVFAGVAALVVAALWRGRLRPAVALPLLCGCAVLDVAVAGRRLLWVAPAALLREAPPGAASLRASGPEPPRLFRAPALDRLPLHRNEEAYLRLKAHLRATLQPNDNARLHLGSLLGYGALRPAEVDPVLVSFAEAELPALARLLGVGWEADPAPAGSGLPTVDIHPLAGALPRARLVGVRLEEGALARARSLVLGGHDFTRRAIVDPTGVLLGGEPVGADEARRLARALPADGGGQAEVVSFRPEEVVVRARAGGPALLVLAEAYFPGWRASIDGAEAPIVRADFLCRGVPVPAGVHLVRFVFEAPALRQGAALSLATALVLGLVGALAALRAARQKV